jgi:glycosyltransferase involved in cell wall biosynthesis
MYRPLISVIIVVYNAQETIKDTIESVAAQNYEAKEIVIIDGGSQDNTLQILEQNRSQIDYLISEKDKGIYDAMNKGIRAARGEWLYFLGSDDILYNGDVLSAIFTQEGVGQHDFVYGNVRMKSNNAIFGGTRTYKELIGKNINHQSIFYKKSVFDVVGDYDLKYKVLADYDLNMRIFREEKLLKRYIPVDICLFNDKGGTSNVTIDSSFFADKLHYFTSREKIAATSPLLQQYNFYSGFVDLMKHKKMKGIRLLSRAFTSGPRKIFYMLVFVKFILGYLGLGKKIRIV